MQWMFGLLLAPLLAICLGATGWGAEPAASKESTSIEVKKTVPKKSTKAKKTKVQKYVGDVSAVDTKTGTVTVKDSLGEKNFVTQDAAKDALTRLGVGDRVRIQYAEKNGKLMASSVRRIKLPTSKSKSSGRNPKVKSAGKPSEAKDAAK